MSDVARRSAVIVPVELPGRLAALRASADPQARRGVPPHVTILFPFLSVAELTAATRATLARVAAAHDPFTARFEHIERRSQMVWLLPRDQAPFLRLTASVHARWPDCPPYGGVHARLIAHLTLVETPDVESRQAIRVAAGESGPFDAAITRLVVLAEDEGGRWRTRWRIALGRRRTAEPGQA